jgi:PhnB protein
MNKTQASSQQVQPYLFFDGKCEEALDFYKSALGAKVDMMLRFKDNPEPQAQGPGCGAGSEDKVMHAAFRVGETLIMASDGMAGGKPEFKGFSLSVTAKDEAEADRLFAALGKGGQVQMPMGKTFFSPRFGLVADKFGVGWMVIVPGAM